MNNRIVITKYNEKYIIVFIKNDIAIKIRAIDSYNDYSQLVYLGRVNSVKKNIDSCFVKYGNKTGFLKGSNKKNESVFPIMLKKETEGNKEDEVTDRITLAGFYVVVSDSIKGISYSNKISAVEKDSINIDSIDNVIIRHNAVNTDKESIINEYKLLTENLLEISNVKDKRTDNSILYKGVPTIIDIISSENLAEFDEVITDDVSVYKLINDYLQIYKEKGIKVNINLKIYDDDTVSLFALMSLSSKIDRAINRKVYLKSDAYITIDKTEALTVIDVNSGTTTFKGDKSSVIHNINIEAAKEVALQLKLRNISGIIIVDFINEYNKQNRDELIKTLNEALKYDDCSAKCHGMTKLGLVEISRKRKQKALKDQLWK